MGRERSGRECIDKSLLDMAEAANKKPWLFIKNLQKGDVLEIQTEHTLYTMLIINPKCGEVIVDSNGQLITQDTEAIVQGSILTPTSAILKQGGIAVGFWLNLWIRGRGRLVLSATQEVRINGFKMLPIEPHTKVH